MDWPSLTVEEIPAESFVPPFCPYPACPQHSRPAGGGDFRRHGSFTRRCDGRRVPRFRCRTCRRTFSQQSFAFSYYLKRPELSRPIARGLVACSCHRQIARSQTCAPSTVARRAARLGRHCLLLQELLLAALGSLAEPVVIDDFETFTGSQFFPCGVGTASGQRSWFVYGLTHAPHRRGGRLSPAQRRQQARLDAQFGKPRRGAYQRAFRSHLDLLLSLTAGEVTVVSDGHPAYGLAVARHPERIRLRHEVHPNPPRGPRGSPRSPAARRRDRAMFAADLLHKLFRHSKSHDRRETIAFARRDAALMERVFVVAIWRNLVKRKNERHGKRVPTPAMELGLTGQRWPWKTVLAQRLQPSRLLQPSRWMEIYRRELITPALRNNPRHELKNAF